MFRKELMNDARTVQSYDWCLLSHTIDEKKGTLQYVTTSQAAYITWMI